MLLNEPTPHHQTRPAAAARTHELPAVEVDSASGPPPRSTANDPTVGIEVVGGSDAVKTVALDVEGVKRALAEGISASDATPTVSLSVSAVRRAMAAEGAIGTGEPAEPAEAAESAETADGADADDSTVAAEDSGDSATVEHEAAGSDAEPDPDSDAAPDLAAAPDAGAGAGAGADAVSDSAADSDVNAGADAAPDSAADFDFDAEADSVGKSDSDTEDSSPGDSSPEGSAAPDTVELSADTDGSTDLVPTAGDAVDAPTATYLVSTDLSTPTSTLVAVPETADDVIATIHAAATAVAAADRRARQAAVVKDDPWTGLDLRRPAVPAPVDNVLDLLSPVLERPLLVVEQPGLPQAADVVALHRSEMEVDFVEPPVVAAGAEPPIPPRYGPGLSVLPHIEFPV